MEYELSKRKAQILRAVVEAYVKTGEPIGSKYIAQTRMPNCSPATIRNEMAELASLGFLEQPHTSAGRIPSELGYRFYVDCLAGEYKKTKAETERMSEALRGKQHELDKILTEASRLAGNMTGLTAIAVKPRTDMAKIIRFEVMYFDSRNLVLALLASNGSSKTRNLRLSFDVVPSDAAHLAATLNRFIAGKTAEEITLPLMMQAEAEMGIDTITGRMWRVTRQRASAGITGPPRLAAMPPCRGWHRFTRRTSITRRLQDGIAATRRSASAGATSG